MQSLSTYISTFFLLCFAGVLFANAGTTPPSPQQLKEYYESGKYFKEVEQKLTEVGEYINRQAEHRNKSRLAMVLDIDETALSNYQDLARLGFTQNLQARTGAYMLGGAQALPAVLALYQKAIDNNVAVFFISERPSTPEVVAVTVKNLKSSGFEQWEELILKPLENDNVSNQEFKTAMRRKIAANGYDIILNVGDNESDIQGGFAEIKVKIPNPFG